MKNIRIIRIFLAVAILCLLVAAVPQRNLSTPERTIKSLEAAVNHLDKDAALRCFDPSISAQIDSLLNDIGKVGGLSLGNMMEYSKTFLPLLPLLSNGKLSLDALPHMSFDVLDVKQDQSKHLTDVSVKVIFHLKEYDFPFSMQVGMCQAKGNWIIQSIHGVELL